MGEGNMCVTQCILCHLFLPLCPTSPILTPTFSHSTWGWGGRVGGWVVGGVIAWESQREGSQSVIVLELRAWFPLPLFPLYRRVCWLPVMQGYLTRCLREVYLYLYFCWPLCYKRSKQERSTLCYVLCGHCVMCYVLCGHCAGARSARHCHK